MLLQFLFFELVGLHLDLVGLHVVLLLAQLLLDPSELQQFGTFVEFLLNIEVILCVFLDSMGSTICF
jgi:hypothetical protein